MAFEGLIFSQRNTEIRDKAKVDYVAEKLPTAYRSDGNIVGEAR
jgi:hypothetical protein